MLKGEIINGYEILENFTLAGGQSKVSTARKKGEVYFIKEFLEPKYPLDDSPGSPARKAKRRKKCLAFEKSQKEINKRISEKCSFGGNLVFAVAFFRSGTTYYKINEKIDISSVTIEDISKLPLSSRLLVMKTVTHSLKILHSLNVVHGDIKPDNVLIKEKGGGRFVSKLIDFDNSYFSGNPPDIGAGLVGDQIYYSPELGNFILEESDDKSKLTTKSDVFALGLLFHQYLTGDFPSFDEKKYQYPWETVIDGSGLTLKIDGVNESLAKLVASMLQLDFVKRPRLEDVFSSLKSIEKGGELVLPVEVIADDIKMTPSSKKKVKKGLVSKTFGKKRDKIDLPTTDKTPKPSETVVPGPSLTDTTEVKEATIKTEKTDKTSASKLRGKMLSRTKKE